jgi:hypothetical protein
MKLRRQRCPIHKSLFCNSSGMRFLLAIQMAGQFGLNAVVDKICVLYFRIVGNSSLTGLRKGSGVGCFLLLSDVFLRPGVFC